MSVRTVSGLRKSLRDNARHARGRRRHVLSDLRRDLLLEDRTLLTVTAYVQNSTLFVVGDAQQDNVVLGLVLGQRGWAVAVQNDGVPVSGSPFATEDVNGNSLFSSVQVTGGTGDFFLTVPDQFGYIIGPTHFTGGSANNTLIGPASTQPLAWYLTGSNTGQLPQDGIYFAGVQNLTDPTDSGGGGETITYLPGGSLSGVIDSVSHNGLTLQTPNPADGTIPLPNNVKASGNLSVEAGTVAAGSNVGLTSDGGLISVVVSQDLTATTGLFLWSNGGDISISAGGTVALGSNGLVFSSGGNILINANSISTGTSTSLSSRVVNLGGATQIGSFSGGNSGNITLVAPSIVLGQLTQVLAHVAPGDPYLPGDVSLTASDSSLRQAALAIPIYGSSLTATITTYSSTILGGNVSITTSAAVQEIYENWGTYSQQMGPTLSNLITQSLGLAISEITGVSGQIIVRQANASINLNSSTINASGTATVGSVASVNSSFHTVAVNGLLGNGAPFSISVGYGEADTSATTTLNNTAVTSTGAASITSSATTNDFAKSRSTAQLGGLVDPNTVALSVAGASTTETSHVSILGTSSVTSSAGSINTDATGNVLNFAWAEPTVFQEGLVSFAIAVDYDNADIKTLIDGTLDAGGTSPTFNANPNQGGVDYTKGTITIPNHGFTDGQAVTYTNGGAPDIGGLKNGSTYYVQVVDPNTIRLANAATLPLSYDQPAQYTAANETSTQSVGILAKIDFDPSSVNTSTSQITSPNFSALVDGQAVVYLGTSNAAGNSGVAPLQANRTYYVEKVSPTVIQLAETPGSTPITLTDAGVGTHSFLIEDPTKTQTFQPVAAVDSNSNTITFSSPHGFQTGDAVLYHTDSSLNIDSNLSGNAITNTDPAIGTLQDGNVYYVVKVNDYTIRLTESKEAALLAAPIALTPASVPSGTDLGTQHALDTNPGVSVHAGLTAVNLVNTSTILSSDTFSGARFLTQAPALSADAIIGGLTLLPETLTGKIFSKDPQSNALPVLNVGFSGAISINSVTHDVEAIVSSNAVIKSSHSILIAADVTENTAVAATAGASKKDQSGGLAVAAAIGFGNFVNTVKATVASGAHLDARDAISVTSNLSYPFNTSTPLNAINPQAWYTSSGVDGWLYFNDGTLGLASNLFNTYVLTQAGNGETSIGGSFVLLNYQNDSEATIGAHAAINQDQSARFQTGIQKVSVNANTEMDMIHVVGVGGLSFNLEGLAQAGSTAYQTVIKNALGTKDGILSGAKSLINPFGAEGEKGGIGASAFIQNISNTTNASIQTGALVNAAGDSRWSRSFEPTQSGVVSNDGITFSQPTGRSTGDAVVYQVGTGGSPIGGLQDGTTYYVIADPTNPNRFQLAASESDAFNAVAIPLDPAGATGSNQEFVGDSGVAVNAATNLFDFGFASSGGSASSFGLSGTFTADILSDKTYAHIDPGAVILSHGAVGVNSADNSTIIGISGGVTSSSSVGIGASVGLNLISRDTQAYIGAGIDPSTGIPITPSANLPTTVQAEGPLTVNAVTNGGLWTASLAAAVAVSQIDGAPTQQEISDAVLAQNAPPKAAKLLGVQQDDSIILPITDQGALALGLVQTKNKPVIAIAGSGDISLNIITQQNTYAFVNDLGTITALAAPVTVRAEDQSTTWSLAGSAALAINASTAKRSVGLAGSISVNVLQGDTRAFVAGPTVAANSIAVQAVRGGGIRSLTAGGAGAPAQNGVAVAGSISVNVGLYSVVSYVSGSTLHLQAPSSVTAFDQSDIWSIAGAFAYGGQLGVGISVAANILGDTGASNQIHAYILGSSLTMTDGSLVIQSNESNPASNLADPRIIAVTGASGLSGSSTGVAGMLSVNLDRTSVGSSFTSSSLRQTDPTSGTVSISLTAIDSSGIIAIGGAVGVGKNAGVGAAISYNEVDGDISAIVDSSSILINGVVEVNAASQASIVSVDVGVAGSGSGFAAAGSFSINLIQDVVQALIISAANPALLTMISANGPISVSAQDESTIVGAAGGVSASLSGMVAGVAVTYNLIQNAITAYAENSTVKSNVASITIQAGSSASVIGIAAGLSASGGESLAGAGSIAINSINDNVDAHISANSDVEATVSIMVEAVQSAPLVSVSGAVAGSGGSVLAGAFSFNYIGGGGNLFNPNAINNPNSPGGALTFDPSSGVDSNAHTITFQQISGGLYPGITQDGFITGQAVVYHNLDAGSTGLAVTGQSPLQEGATYYVIAAGPNSIQLASTRANALAGIALPITNVGTTSTKMSISSAPSGVTSYIDNATAVSLTGSIIIDGGLVKPLIPLSQQAIAKGQSVAFDPAQAVTTGGTILTLPSSINLPEGQAVVYHNGGGGSLGTQVNQVDSTPLKDGGVYYIHLVPGSNGTQIQLYSDPNQSTNYIHFSLNGTSGTHHSFTASQINALSGSQALVIPMPVDLESQLISVTVSGGVSLGGLAAGGSVSLNFIRNTVDTGIHNINRSEQVTSQGPIVVDAADTSKIVAVAGGISISGGSVSVGASVSYDDIQNVMTARIGSALTPTPTNPLAVDTNNGNTGVISGNSINVSAESSASITNVTFDLKAAEDAALGAAISVNKIAEITDAHIANSGIVSGTTGVGVSSSNTSSIFAFAGSAAGAVGVSVGAGVGYNQISNEVLAFVANSTLSGSNLAIGSNSSSTIESVSLGVAVGAGGLAGSGTGNLIDNMVVAAITGGSQITMDDNVTLAANSNNSTSAYGGALALGGEIGAGGAVAVNKVTNSTLAYINGTSHVTANGNGSAASVPTWGAVANGRPAGAAAGAGTGTTENDHGIAITASTTENLNDIVAAAGLAPGGLGIALDVLVNVVSDTTHAYINQAVVSAAQAGLVIVRAHQDTEDNNGGGSLGAGQLAGAVGVNVDVVNNTTSAEILGTQVAPGVATTVTGNSGIEVSSLSRTNITTTSIGLAIATLGAIAGSVSGLSSGSKTSAIIDGANAIANAGPINVAANNAVSVGFHDGAGAGGVFIGGAGSIAVGVINDQTIAKITDNAFVRSSEDTNIQADSAETINTSAGTVAISGVAGLAGTVAVISLTPITIAAIENSKVSAGALAVVSNDSLSIPSDAVGAGGGAIGVGVGFAIEVVTIHNTVAAYINGNSQVTGTSVTLSANGLRNLSNTVVGFGLGGIAGLEGAFSILTIGVDLDATASSQVQSSQDKVNQSLMKPTGSQSGTVSGLDTNTAGDTSLAQPTSIGTQLQSGANSSLFNISLSASNPTVGATQAYIGSGAKVSATSGDIQISATEEDNITLAIGGGALSIVAAAGASVGIANIQSDTEAFIASGATADASGNVSVTATFSDNVTVKSYGAQGAIGLAIGAVYSSINDTSTQKAYIAGNVSSAQSITISALSPNHSLQAYDFGFVGGLAAVGVTIGQAQNAGTTTAYLDSGAQLGSSVGSLSITASSGTLANSTAIITAAVGVGGRVNKATATITPTISARIGQGNSIAINGDLNVTATSTLAEGHADAQSYGGGGIDIGAGAAVVTTSPVVQAYVDQGNQITTSGKVNIRSSNDAQPPTNSPDTFNPSTTVNTGNGTINFPTSLGTGTAVQYQADPTTNSPVGGLHSRQITLTVNVQNPNQSTFQFFRNDGGNWVANGFTPGVTFNISSATDPALNGVFTVTGINGNELDTTGSHISTGTIQNAILTLNRVYRVLNPSVQASGLVFADASTGNTITRATGSWLTDGFIAGESVSVSGSTNQGIYTIQTVTDSTITLTANGPAWSQSGTISGSITITARGAFRFGISFDSSQLNTSNDTIVFNSPHGFQTGDAVKIDTQGNMTPSVTYYVRKVDDYTIQLAATLADAISPPRQNVSPGDYDSTSNAFNLSSLANGQPANSPFLITYHAPPTTTFYSRDLNVTYDNQGNQSADLNRIYVSLNNLKDGDTVTYSYTGTVSPIQGFSQGQQFAVRVESTDSSAGTSMIYLYAVGDLLKTPIPLTASTTPGAQGSQMSLIASGFGPLTAMKNGVSTPLVDGDTYTAIPVSGKAGYYQIQDSSGVVLTSFDTSSATWNAAAAQSFSAGTLVIPLGAGPHSIYIDLSTAPNQNDRLTSSSGGSLSGVGGPVGSGSSSASAEGGGGGIGEFAFPTASVIANPVVWAYSSATTLSTSQDVSISANSTSNVSASVTNGGGGVVAVGQVQAIITQQADTQAFVGVSTSPKTKQVDATGETITANNFTLKSTSSLTSTASASAVVGGAIGGAVAHTSDQVNEWTYSQIGTGGKVQATGDVQILADSQKVAHTNAYSLAIAIGGGANSDQQSFDTPSGVQVGSSSTPTGSLVLVGQSAIVTGNTVTLKSTQSKTVLESDASATAISPIFLGVDVALATTNVVDYATSNVQIVKGASITGIAGVDILSVYTLPTASTSRHAVAVAIIPITGGSDNPFNNANTQASISADVTALVTAGVRSTTGPLTQVSQDSTGGSVANVALNVQAFYSNDQGNSNSTGNINWASDVSIPGAIPLADTLVIDGQGNTVVKDGIQLDQVNNNYVATVLPAQGPSVYFYGLSQLVDQAPLPTFTFSPTLLSNITILNASSKQLTVNDIDVPGLGAKPEVYLDSPNQRKAGDASSAFNFHIVVAPAPVTRIDIENTNASGPLLQVGDILNPIGETTVKNFEGVLTAAPGSTIRTNILHVLSGGGDLGTTTQPLSVEMVQYKDDSGQSHQPLLGAVARDSIYLSILGRQRDRTLNPVTILSDGLVAGSAANDNVFVYEQQGIADGAPLTVLRGIWVSATQQSHKEIYLNDYYPDSNAQSVTNTDYAVFADSSSSPGQVRTIYQFAGYDLSGTSVHAAGIIAGGNVQVTPSLATAFPTIDVEATLNMNPAAGATGKLSVDANGVIQILETVGALRVGTIRSEATTINYPGSGPASVTLASLAMNGYQPGSNIVMDSSATISSQEGVSLGVQNDFTMAAGATITSPTFLTLSIDDIADQSRLQPGNGSTVQIAGSIQAPIETITQNQTVVPLSDNISLTNVQNGTTATITMVQGQNLITLGSLYNFTTQSSWNGGQLSNIAGPITVHGTGADILNLDDTGDVTAWTTAQFPTITATNVTGMGMPLPPSGRTPQPFDVGYTGLSALNLKLGTQPQTIDVLSTAAGTTTTITSQVGGNTWNVGSHAPANTAGVLAGVQGPLIINGGGVTTSLTDTLNVDDSGSTLANETGLLTDSSITGLGMGVQGITYHGMSTLHMALGDNATALQGLVATNLPMTTTITGGSGNTDTFHSNWSHDFNGSLTLSHLGDIRLVIAGEFYGNLVASDPAHIQLLDVKGSVHAGASISVQQLDILLIGNELDINLNVPGIPTAPVGTWAIGNATISGRLPQGITLSAGSIGSLLVGDSGSGDNNLSGNVVTVGDLGSLTEAYGSIATTSTITVGRNLNTLVVGTNSRFGATNMAGVIDVAGMLGSGSILGGTPGLFQAGRVGTINTLRGYGPVVLHVIEAGIDRRVELAAPGQFYLQPNPSSLAGPSPVLVHYLYESDVFPNPQLSARIDNQTSAAADQFDLSLVVLQDSAQFNLAQLDAYGSSHGVSGIRNVAVEGALVPGTSAAYLADFGSYGLPAGIYLPNDHIAGIGIRDYAPKAAILVGQIQGIAFGSFTNSMGQVKPGSQATPLDAAALLAPGSGIVTAGSVDGSSTETFRVPFASLPGQQTAFFLSTANSGGSFDPNKIVLTLQSNSDGVHTPTTYLAARGAVTAMIGVSTSTLGSIVQTVDLQGDGGSIFSNQFIAQAITSTGPLGDVTVTDPRGLNNLSAPSVFGNIAAAGPLFGTIQTTGVRIDPITGVSSQVSSDLGRVYAVQGSGRTAQKYVTTTTIGGQGPNSLSGKIISRGNLISSIRSDGGASGLIAAQGNLGAFTTLLGPSTRVGGLTVNGGFSGQLVVLGDSVGDLAFHGGLTGGRIAVKGSGGSRSGIIGNVLIDTGLYATGDIGPGSGIFTGGEIGDASLGTGLTVTGQNLGIVAAKGAIRLAKGSLAGCVFNNVGLNSGDPNAAAIDAIFSSQNQSLNLDLPNQPLAGLELILEALASIHIGPDGKLKN